MWIWVWLGIVAVTLVFEFVTMEMASIWFSLGAFVALILSACGASLEAQWIVFGVVSIASILGLRKVSLKWLQRDEGQKVTSKELTIGKQFELLTSISKTTPGTIKINGVEWSAICKIQPTVDAGTMVEVVELVGNKYVVKPVKEKE